MGTTRAWQRGARPTVDHRERTMKRRVLAVAGLLVMAGCGGKSPKSEAKRPTVRQQDSMIAGSNIPGARAVGAAMRVADSADARRKREDSVSSAVP